MLSIVAVVGSRRDQRARYRLLRAFTLDAHRRRQLVMLDVLSLARKRDRYVGAVPPGGVRRRCGGRHDERRIIFHINDLDRQRPTRPAPEASLDYHIDGFSSEMLVAVAEYNGRIVTVLRIPVSETRSARLRSRQRSKSGPPDLPSPTPPYP